ncbi:hypothetical protein DDE18_17890 [Nocardioides gansuensis]|uniref:Uncharacterized protein n=1 Tax=Nocardioides gansuensis TaxID=2138300 RepID=A0A2T8F6M6_9ACTN|nr:hypothetical protein [Nocardioides gansuensis]PVG81360.1 hypothetical protein DDE18_17890 [Nocardioides gansuensis]
MEERAGDGTGTDDRTALRLARNELKWTRNELEHQAEALQRVRRQRARLREQAESLAAALAAELSAAYWRDQDPGRGRLRRRSADPETELVREVEAHPLFDAGWYLRQHQKAILEQRIPPALHHVRHANERRLDPSEGFSTGRYLLRHPEAGGSGLPALLHAHRHGLLDDGLVDVVAAEG